MRRLANQVALALVAVLGLTSFAAAGATSKLPPTADCATIAAGSHGPAVVTLQRAVKATPDGDFGPLTAKAVATWQRKHAAQADRRRRRGDMEGAADRGRRGRLRPAQRRHRSRNDVHDLAGRCGRPGSGRAAERSSHHRRPRLRTADPRRGARRATAVEAAAHRRRRRRNLGGARPHRHTGLRRRFDAP